MPGEVGRSEDARPEEKESQGRRGCAGRSDNCGIGALEMRDVPEDLHALSGIFATIQALCLAAGFGIEREIRKQADKLPRGVQRRGVIARARRWQAIFCGDDAVALGWLSGGVGKQGKDRARPAQAEVSANGDIPEDSSGVAWKI